MLNRRQALSSMALISGAAFIPKSCSISKAGRQRGEFSFSLNTSTISGQKAGMLKNVEIAAEAGYDSIELWVRDVQAYISAGNSTASLNAFIKDRGITVSNAIGFAPWMTGGEIGLYQMEMEMDLMAELDCRRIAAPAAGVDQSKPLDLMKAGETFARLIELGRKTGVMPQLEFWGASGSLFHIGQALQIAAAANDEDVKILPDVYHMFRGNSGFHSLKMLSGNLIDIFHMNDYPGSLPRLEQTDADRVYPGDGVAPIVEILKDLKNMGGDKILSLELFNRTYWEEDPLSVAKTGLSKMKRLVDAAAS